MASENVVTLVGNITDDPELRFTPSGLPVANFTVAVNRRVPKDGGWEDKLEGFFRCSCWRDMAENVAESLTKGARVMVVGRLQQRSWEDQDGNKRSAVEVQVDEVGPSLRWATARPERSQRSGGGFGGGGSQPDRSQGSSPAPAQGGDSWGPPASVGGSVPDEGGF
jgi:single-strand DNA-binding protein